MKLRARCFPIEYYENEILTDSEVRQRLRNLTVYSFAIVMIGYHTFGNIYFANSYNVTYETQNKTQIHKSLANTLRLRGGDISDLTHQDVIAQVLLVNWLTKNAMLQTQMAFPGFIRSDWSFNHLNNRVNDNVNPGLPFLKPNMPPGPRGFIKFGGNRYGYPSQGTIGPNSITSLGVGSGNPPASLTPEQRRNWPDFRDLHISFSDNRPKVTIRYHQAKFKLKDHGEVVGLPYTLNMHNKTSTMRTEDNILSFMQKIREIVISPSSTWFNKGHERYQGFTTRGFPAIHVYEPARRIIIVFKASTGEFVTICRLTIQEALKLYQTGNFGGE